MNIQDKKNHLTQKQIWLLKMLFDELGNKNLNEALRQWEEYEIQRSTKDTSSNNRRRTGNEELISRLEMARETSVGKAIPAEDAIRQEPPDGSRRGIKGKPRAAKRKMEPVD